MPYAAVPPRRWMRIHVPTSTPAPLHPVQRAASLASIPGAPNLAARAYHHHIPPPPRTRVRHPSIRFLRTFPSRALPQLLVACAPSTRSAFPRPAPTSRHGNSGTFIPHPPHAPPLLSTNLHRHALSTSRSPPTTPPPHSTCQLCPARPSCA